MISPVVLAVVCDLVLLCMMSFSSGDVLVTENAGFGY